ncbi:diacylglycerol/lipid kinase family protein [Methylobacterium sp. ID0610]|uniref:diacylglycerol/lipid kinase family protein n=1 Tax=Methylobacterium carpenticola TaxID=3344827 RepID=UPI00368D9CB0
MGGFGAGSGRRVVLVTNGASGALAERGLDPARPAAALAAAGLDVVAEPAPTLPLPERLRAAAALPGIDALVVAGGDGTLACAAESLAGSGIPLGILPAGTMNLLARDLGLPLDLDAAARVVASGHPRAIDLGEVNGRIFAINSVLGMPARMQRHREARRGRFGLGALLGMAALLWRHLGRYPRMSATLDLAGTTRRIRFRTLAVVVGDYREDVGAVLLRSGVDRGRFTLYVIAALSAQGLLRLGLGFAVGRWRQLPDLDRTETTQATLAVPRRRVRVMNDGEVILLKPPLTYRIRPAALRVLVPREDDAP